jgi:hypothetical protein
MYADASSDHDCIYVTIEKQEAKMKHTSNQIQVEANKRCVLAVAVAVAVRACLRVCLIITLNPMYFTSQSCNQQTLDRAQVQ